MAIRSGRTRAAMAAAAVLLGLSATVGAGLAVAAEEAPAQPAWSSACEAPRRDAPLDCRIEQRAVLAASGQLVASVTIRVPGDSRKPLLMVRLPLGLSLEGGVTLSVDGSGARALALQTCDGGGCYAGAPLPPALLEAMRSGGSLDLVFTGLDKRPIKLALPLAGFAAAFDGIQ